MPEKRDRAASEATSDSALPAEATTPHPADPPRPLQCGLVMPISTIDGLGPDHWTQVKAILEQAVEQNTDPSFSVRLVSHADDTGVIQKRIVQNLYHDPIVVCDVSGKNPNVMFELGMRIAFNKPVVIVKDDETGYPFDTGVIEHLEYPRSLRFHSIVEFQKRLAGKVAQTYRSFQGADNDGYLSAFGEFRVARLQETEVPRDQFILDALLAIRERVDILAREQRRSESRGQLERPLDPANKHLTNIRHAIYGLMRFGLGPMNRLLESPGAADRSTAAAAGGPLHFALMAGEHLQRIYATDPGFDESLATVRGLMSRFEGMYGEIDY